MIPELFLDPLVPRSWIAICSLDKRRRENKDLGYVYIMWNKMYKEKIFKIGKTSRLPYARRAELSSSTGVPDDFDLVYYIVVSNLSFAERFVHQELQEFRYRQNKEFFKVPLKQAIQSLDKTASYFPIRMGGYNSKPIYLNQDLTHVIVNCPQCNKTNRIKQILIPVKVTCPHCHFKYQLIPS